MGDESDSFEFSAETMVLIWRIFIITIIAIYIMVFTATYISKDFDPSSIEANLFKNRVLFSPNCLAYEDKIPHPGIIDLDKLDRARLNDCYKKNNFNFEIILRDLNNNEIKSAQSSSDMQLAPLCGAINVKCSQLNEYVLVRDESEIKPALMEVYILKNA